MHPHVKIPGVQITLGLPILLPHRRLPDFQRGNPRNLFIKPVNNGTGRKVPSGIIRIEYIVSIRYDRQLNGYPLGASRSESGTEARWRCIPVGQPSGREGGNPIRFFR